MSATTAHRRALAAMTLVFAVCSAPHAWPLDSARIVFAGRTRDHATNIYVTTPEGPGSTS